MAAYSTGMEPKPAATAAQDDACLIQAIVRGKDRDAFAELAKRFESPAFQLALHITGRRALAEEAVQDALLAVWHGAESFRPDGDLRRWILGIVAHRALRATRKERRSRRDMEREIERQRIESARPRPEEGAERNELLGALRELLGRLPEVERKLVALYYSAGMTQEEIGAVLDMPQRTVSFKLQACLEHLRKNLAQAGMAAAAPLLTPQMIGSVLESGPETAPGLAERTIARCDKPFAPRESGARSARAAASGGSKALAAGAVAAAVLASAAYWAWDRVPSAKPGLQAKPPAAASPAAPETAVAEAPAELRTWEFRFDQAPPEGFEYVQGAWRLGAFGPQGRIGLIAGTETSYNAFLLPELGHRLPMKATVRFQSLRQGDISVGLGWSDGKQSFGARKWWSQPFTVSRGKDTDFCCWFLGPHTVSAVGDWVGIVCLDRGPVDRRRMFFTGANIGVESIEIREVREEDIPANIRDVDALLRARTEDREGVQGYRWSEAHVRPLAEYLKEQAAEK